MMQRHTAGHCFTYLFAWALIVAFRQPLAGLLKEMVEGLVSSPLVLCFLSVGGLFQGIILIGCQLGPRFSAFVDRIRHRCVEIKSELPK